MDNESLQTYRVHPPIPKKSLPTNIVQYDLYSLPMAHNNWPTISNIENKADPILGLILSSRYPPNKTDIIAAILYAEKKF